MFNFFDRPKKQEIVTVKEIKPEELTKTKELPYPQPNYYSGFVEISREDGRLEAHLTEAGKAYLDSLTPGELRAYFDGIMTHSPTADFNIVGTGLVIKASEYLAFKTLTAGIIIALTKGVICDKKIEEPVNP